MMIKNRQNAREKGFDSLIANLESKYGKSSKGGKSNDDEWEDIDDEDDDDEKPKPTKRKAPKKSST